VPPQDAAQGRGAAGLDVAQVRAEIAQLRPEAAAPAAALPPAAPAAVRPPDAQAGKGRPAVARGATDAALCVLKAALTSERQRTTELRAEIDALQVALASAEHRFDIMRGERDLWAGRAQLLARAMAQEADDIQQAGQSRPRDDTGREELPDVRAA
jgi:hypothetical protein